MEKILLPIIQRELTDLANPAKAKVLQGFFKTGKGQYGEGDVFLGITVPVQRTVAKKFMDLPLSDLGKLIRSRIHEHRFTALEILVMQFERGDGTTKKRIFDFYLSHTAWINNWDLVDTSTPYIVGEFLLNRNRKILYRLAKSKNLWERRIAIVSTFAFIRNNQFQDTLAIAEILLSDPHDLIHKAVGWMLREAGKRNEKSLIRFLDKHRENMPRTMLRYAIERLPLPVRQQYMNQSLPKKVL